MLEDDISEGHQMKNFCMIEYLYRQKAFSEKTFGPVARLNGVIDHIRKELIEVEADPVDLKEWIDVVTLALDGAWRAGFSPEQIVYQLKATLDRNEGRKWPDWRTQPADRAIEHERTTGERGGKNIGKSKRGGVADD